MLLTSVASGLRVKDTGQYDQLCVVGGLEQVVSGCHCFELASVDEIRSWSDA